MEKVLKGLQWQTLLLYLDDVSLFQRLRESSGAVGRGVPTVPVSTAKAETGKMPVVSAGSPLLGARG